MPGDLDAAIRERLDWDRQQAITAPEERIVDVALYAVAIRAALAVHRLGHFGTPCCLHDGYAWPCDTVTAIATALGVSEEVPGGSGR